MKKWHIDKQMSMDLCLLDWFKLNLALFLEKLRRWLRKMNTGILSNIDEVLSINPSANIFVFGDFNVHHKDWLTYSCGNDWLVNSVTICLSQMTLLRWLTFLIRSQTVILIVLLFSIYLFLLRLVFVLEWFSLQLEILLMLLSQFPLTFHQIHNKVPCVIA